MLNRQLSFFASLMLLLFLASCEPTTVNDQGTDTTEAPIDATTDDDRSIDLPPTLAAPTCEVEGEVLDGNSVWLQSPDVLAVIKADAATATEDYGPSHRILELLDGRSCDVKHTATLPENTSPDFPYYIADIQYNNGSNLLGIRGFYDAYVCNLDNDYKLTKCTPSYYTEREYDDPQTGMIQRLEVWEDYLLGYAQDVGAFAFNLTDPTKAIAVLPFAEWQDTDNARYHSLFLLPTESGVQGILPFYDAEEDSFLLYPLFDTPQQVSTNVSKSARNNQHLVLRTTNGNQPLAINLGSRDLMDLPTDVAAKGTQEILSWMKEQGE